MFGVDQERLVKSLSKIRKSICYYLGDNGCDCKYLSNEKELGSNECSGCPEIYQAMDIIAAMTPVEFNNIRMRAKVTISEIDFYNKKQEVELTQFEILELKKIVEKVKREKESKPRKSAYQPSKFPKGVL